MLQPSPCPAELHLLPVPELLHSSVHLWLCFCSLMFPWLCWPPVLLPCHRYSAQISSHQTPVMNSRLIVCLLGGSAYIVSLQRNSAPEGFYLCHWPLALHPEGVLSSPPASWAVPPTLSAFSSSPTVAPHVWSHHCQVSWAVQLTFPASRPTFRAAPPFLWQSARLHNLADHSWPFQFNLSGFYTNIVFNICYILILQILVLNRHFPGGTIDD